ncbi:PepSY domain-containing protein [Nonomuraea rhizosphaerae]|uniref:PepSY domain-containing protein n=1 Tax=Nonomuraea rhizosphaerae TaxID=2665663 RepID=UPI001C5EB371|nr:PepSY domain-containing protein [Nonomuraea rhizosphaerae]
MNTFTKFVVAGASVVALAAGGGAAYAATNADTSADTSTATSAAPPQAPKVTAEQAIQIASKQVAGSWVKEVSFDARGTQPDVWEVEVVNGNQDQELDIDAATGKVLAQNADTSDDDGDDDQDDD